MNDPLSRVREQILYKTLPGAPSPWVKTLANPEQVFTQPGRLISDGTMEGAIYEHVTDFDDPSTNIRVVHKTISKMLKPDMLEKVIHHFAIFDRFQRGKPWVGQSLGYYFTVHPKDKKAYQLNLINEFIEGTSLKDFYGKHQKATPEMLYQILSHARDVFAMCEVMERDGMAHMDIKLDNIMVDKGTGNLVLIDFALFCITSDGGVSCRDAAGGTPGYMAPEAWERYPTSKDQNGPKAEVFKYKADIWSTSMTFLEVMTEPHYLERVFKYDVRYERAMKQLKAKKYRQAPTEAYFDWTATKVAMREIASQDNINALYRYFDTKPGADDYGLIRTLLDGLTFDAEDRPDGHQMLGDLELSYQLLLTDFAL